MSGAAASSADSGDADAEVPTAPSLLAWEDLPMALRRRMSTDGKQPSAEVFCNLFADRVDLEQVVESAGFVSGSVEWLHFLDSIEDMLQQSQSRTSDLQRARAARTGRNFVARQGLSLVVPTGVASSREALISSSAVKRQLHWPCRMLKRQALATNEGGRALAEAKELQRWRTALANILKEADMPICAQVMYMANPDKVLELSAGNLRPSTLRQRVREWRKFSAWCMVSTSKPWTAAAHVLVDYLEELFGQPCARTKLRSVLSAVSLIERAGGVIAADRLSTCRVVLNVVDTRTAELEQGAPDIKRALPLPLIMVMSLELIVLDDSMPKYWRAFSWVRLLKIWTASRTDDVLGILPDQMLLGRLASVECSTGRRHPEQVVKSGGYLSLCPRWPGWWSLNGWKRVISSGNRMAFPSRGTTWFRGRPNPSTHVVR